MNAAPELVMFGGAGAHGTNLAATTERLAREGAWKNQRIVMVIPAGPSIPAKVALSHASLVFPPNNGVIRVLAQGFEVGAAYSSAIESILAHPQVGGWEYLLTVEHDNTPPVDGVLRLVETLEARPELAAVSGLYFTKGFGGCAQIWGDPRDAVLNFRPQVPRAGEVVECCGIGMGFALWRLPIFRDARLARPWFRTVAGPQGAATQDLAFWSNARGYGYRCAVDCRVIVGHYDQEGKFGVPDFTW